MRWLLRIWRNFRESWERYALQLSGALFLLAVMMVGLAAMISANNLLFLIWSVLIATMLVSSVAGRLSLAGLSVEIQLPEHLSAQRPAVAKIRLRNHKRWSPSFSIRLRGPEHSVLSRPLYFPYIGARGESEAAVEVRFPSRGIEQVSPLGLATRFPFGFLERRAEIDLDQEVLVYPNLDPQPGFEQVLERVLGEALAQQGGASGDFHRLRPYQSGESARRIDWKTSARAGEPFVREFASQEDTPVEVFFDQRADGRMLEWFERAVDCAAYLVWHLARTMGSVRFSTQTTSISIPGDGDVYTILKYLALVTPVSVRVNEGVLQSLNGRNSIPIVISGFPEDWPSLREGVPVLSPGRVPFAGPDAGAAGHRQA